MSRRFFALLMVSLIGVVACSGNERGPCPEGADQWLRYQLFMGRSTSSGETVDDAEWETFLSDTVTPRFPDGLTVLDGFGQWRNAEGEVQGERSTVLIILVPEEAEAMPQIDEISYEYERRFMQESVLRVVDYACVSFS